MTKTSRFLILNPEERRRVHCKYFPWLNLTLALDETKPFSSEFGVGMLKDGRVLTFTESHAVEVRRRGDHPRISFRLTLEGVTQARLSTGEHSEAGIGECLVMPHRKDQTLLFSPGRRSVLTLEEDAISDYVQRHYHVDAPRKLRFAEVFKFQGTAFTDVVPMIDLIIDSKTCFDGGRSAVQDQLQETLIAYVVQNAPHNFKSRLSSAEHPVIHRCARRARDFMHAHIEHPITLADMAEAARCSPRQLQLTFRDCFGTSPTAMLRKLRLEAAAARLAEGSCNSVTEVAFSLGYSNLGRFASEFRREFGRKPSDLLRFGPITQERGLKSMRSTCS